MHLLLTTSDLFFLLFSINFLTSVFEIIFPYGSKYMISFSEANIAMKCDPLVSCFDKLKTRQKVFLFFVNG